MTLLVHRPKTPILSSNYGLLAQKRQFIKKYGQTIKSITHC